MKESKRKAFNFFKSYFDVYNELSDKDKVSFMDALLNKQFFGEDPTNLKGMANFAYLSQKHNIDSQVKGFEDKTKTSLNVNNNNPKIGGAVGGSVQGKEEGKEEEQVVLNIIPNKQDKFEKFWLLYPKKINKKDSLKKWMKLSDEEIIKIAQTIKSFIQYKPFDNYVHPNPTTYLNQRRWEDEIPKVKKPEEETDEERNIRLTEEAKNS